MARRIETPPPLRDTNFGRSRLNQVNNFALKKTKRPSETFQYRFQLRKIISIIFLVLSPCSMTDGPTPSPPPSPPPPPQAALFASLLFALIPHAATMSSLQTAHPTTRQSLLDTKASAAAAAAALDFALKRKCPDEPLSNVK